MELTKQTYEALVKLTSFEELEAFLRVSTIKGAAGKSKFNMHNYVSVDITQSECLTGVYHDPDTQLAVATDTYSLVTSKRFYNPEMAGQIIDKSGKFVKTKTSKQNENGIWEEIVVTPKYPNYQSIIARTYNYQYETKVPVISEKYKQEVLKYEAQRKAEKRKPESLYIGFRFDQETTIWFNYEYLNKFITACKFLRATSIFYQNISKPIVADTEHGTALLMPVKPETEKGVYITEWEKNFAMLNNPNEVAPEQNENSRL